MNFESKIEEMERKGVFSKMQAQRLKASFAGEKSGSEAPKRRYILEGAGAILTGAAAAYIYAAVAAAGTSRAIEDISHSLNLPPGSGMGAHSSFVLIVLLIAVVIYLLFYLYARNCFGSFRKISEEIGRLEAQIHDMTLMKKELAQALEKLSAEEKQPDALKYVMKSIRSAEQDLLAQKAKKHDLRAKCRRRMKLFCGSAASLAGKLPQCG